VNRLHKLILLTVTCLFSISYGSSANEVILSIRIVDQPTSAEIRGLNESPLDITGRPATDLRFSVPFGEKDLIKELTVNAKWQNDTLILKIKPPFSFEGVIELPISAPPTHVDAGSDAVRKLWGTSWDKLEIEDLFSRFGEARVVAESRMKGVNDQWDRLSVVDVRAVFKYLEAAKHLSRELFVVPPGSVGDANEWLRNAIRENPRIVGRAVGKAQAEQLVEFIESDEGHRFTLLWREIIKAECVSKDVRPLRLRLLQNYRALYLSIPIDRRQKIDSTTMITLQEIQSSISQCLAEYSRRVGANEDIPKDEINRGLKEQIKSLENLKDLDSLSGQPLNTQQIRKTNSDIKVLRDILDKF